MASNPQNPDLGPEAPGVPGESASGKTYPEFAPSRDPSSADPVPELVDFEVSDLRQAAVETLGSYMLGTTEKNYYHPNSPLNQSNPDDPNILGTPAQIDVTAGPDENVFFADLLDEARAYFATISGGSTPDAIGGGALGDINDLLNKSSQTDGHALLAKIVGDAWSTVRVSSPNTSDTGQNVRDKISDVLKYNRFQPGGDSPYIQDEGYSDGMFSIQNDLGRYDPEANAVALESLAKIAFSMMLTATGAGPDANDPDSADSTNAIGAGIMNQLQLQKIDTYNLETNYATGFPGNPPQNYGVVQKGIRRKGSKTEDYDAKNSKSYGVLNSYLEPFDGPLPTAMLILAVLAAVAVLIAGVILMAVMTLIFLLFSPAAEEEPPEPLPLGAAAGQPDFGRFSIRKWLQKMLRLPIIRSGKTWIAAMFFGAIQFYWRITDAISSGYFIVVSRAAIRDLEQISDALASADFSNIVGGLESIFIVLDAFATSTSFQFLNTLTALGDIVLMSGGINGGGYMPFSPHLIAALAPDNVTPSVANLHKKSRTWMNPEEPDYRLAWRFGSLPSRYILPTNILGSAAALGRNNAFAAASSMPKGVGGYGDKTEKFGSNDVKDVGESTEAGEEKFRPSLVNGRYSAAQRMVYEDILDAYYIPFYLHDLRTNEILALHTFIENFTDSFSPEWTSVSGFGRMDDVKIYKKTTRKMGLSFYMVATNPEDQDELYYAINKLVTMVYPQWSAGTQKTVHFDDVDKHFIMPFSQVPTASPLVRLRVGDLWSSNFTTHSLSRLFGLGTSSFLIDGKVPGGLEDGGTIDELRENVSKVLENLQDLIPDNQTGPPPAEEALANNAAAALGGVGVSKGLPLGTKVWIASSKYKKGTLIIENMSFDKEGGKVKITQPTKGKVVGYVIKPVIDMDAPDNKKTARKKARARVRYAVEVDPDSPARAEMATSEPDWKGVLLAGHSDLQVNLDEMVLDAISQGIGAPADAGGIPNPFAEPPEPTLFTADFLNDFFSTKNNSIVRSFEESGGKGIAGAITQLDFDWNLAPWDERHGSRAPTYVKVTMGFDPIHDIPLGLDHEGGIRAPAYNVGSIVRGIFGSGGTLQGEIAAVENLRAIRGLSNTSPEAVEAEEGTTDPEAVAD